MDALRGRGIGTQVHYMPVHLQPYYRAATATSPLPGAPILLRALPVLPLFPAMTDDDVDRVAAALSAAVMAES